MVCILLALPNITFFLMFSAHKPLQSTSWVSDHLMMSPDGVCAYVCFCCLSSQWGFHSLAPKQFLGFLWFCLLLSNLNPWNSLTGATVPGIKPQVLWCVSVIYFCNSVLSGFPNIWFWCTWFRCRLIVCLEVLSSSSRWWIPLSPSFFWVILFAEIFPERRHSPSAPNIKFWDVLCSL